MQDFSVDLWNFNNDLRIPFALTIFLIVVTIQEL
jgi:hypothetical protein